MTQSEQLRHYNRWRRGEDGIEQPNPTELGELLDTVADRLEAIERDNAQIKELCEEAHSLLMEAEPAWDCAYLNWADARRKWAEECRAIGIQK